MYCHQCGSQLPDHVKFCPKCGVWVSDAPPNQTALDQKRRIPVLGIAVISIFIVAAAAIAVIMAAYTRASRQGSSPTAAGHLTDKESDHMTKAGESDQNDTVADIALGAYAEKVQELAADDSTLLFALIDIDGNDIPELVADSPGCYVSLYTWADGGLITLMDAWVYGAMGNQGYDYIPGHNIVHNYNFDQGGAVVLETYLAINKYYELTALSGDLRLCYFNDTNRNGIADENEPFTEEPFYYFGDAEITEEEYDSYHIEGDYEWISGDKTAAEILELFEAGSSEMFAVVYASSEEFWDQYEPGFEKIMDSYTITEHSETSSGEVPFGYEGDESYTDYMYWGGLYDGGWMDTELWFGLYSDGSQEPECGYITTTFRGMEDTGKLYYMGANEFRWESEGYDSASPETYYICAVYDGSSYQLMLYNSDGEYEVTFTLSEQYIP